RTPPGQEVGAITVDDIGEAPLPDRPLTATREELEPRAVSRLNPDTYIRATVTTPGNAERAREVTREGVRRGESHRRQHVSTREPVSLVRSRLVDWSVTPLNVASLLPVKPYPAPFLPAHRRTGPPQYLCLSRGADDARAS